MSDTSRDPALLDPQLRSLWEYGRDEYQRRYSGERPFLTATYRGPVDQQKAVDAGTSKAKFGESLHNYRPAYAFDIAFLKVDGSLDWTRAPFQRFADILKPLGIEWGGDWTGLVDGPHYQLPMSAADAKAGNVPTLAQRLLVVQDAAGANHSFPIPAGADVLVRVSVKDRVYVTIK